jgi:opacity protein-like surface antigen
MKNLVGVFVLVVLCSLPTMAQETPTIEAGGGYMYRSQEVPFDFPINTARINMNGWNATFQYNVNPWLGIAADFDGTYHSDQGVSTSVYTYTFGVRAYPWHHPKAAPFFNLLIGGGRGKATLNGVTHTDNSFALEGGGGLEIKLDKHWAFRPVELDYELTRFGSSSPGFKNQNNYKYKLSLLYTFGEK